MTYKTLIAVLTTAAILLALNYETPPSSPLSIAALDLNCGFTDHFSAFLKEEGKNLLMQDIADGTSSEMT
jgi:hypothetical protein